MFLFNQNKNIFAGNITRNLTISRFYYLHGNYNRSSSFSRMVPSVAIAGTTFDPDSVVQPKSDEFVSDEATAWKAKLEPFSGELKEVPPRETRPKDHEVVLEANAKVQLAYVKAQLLKNGVSEQVYAAWILPTVKIAKKEMCDRATLTTLKKILSRGKFKGFMEAVSIQTQVKRELGQQMPDIGITEQEFQDAQSNLRLIDAARSAWGRYTSTKDYIRDTAPKTKLEAEKAFQVWVESKATQFTKIVSMTVNDLPPTYAPAEIGDFESNPTSVEAKKNVVAALRTLQKQALGEWRKDKAGFKLATFLESK